MADPPLMQDILKGARSRSWNSKVMAGMPPVGEA